MPTTAAMLPLITGAPAAVPLLCCHVADTRPVPLAGCWQQVAPALQDQHSFNVSLAACMCSWGPALSRTTVPTLTTVMLHCSGGLCRFFWCWNRNSGDTGGLVAEDWATLEWEKLSYLSLIGLRPWFLDWVRLCLVLG